MKKSGVPIYIWGEESTFHKALKVIFEHEGFYSDDPDDRGGETIWGITKRVARSYGYKKQMILMPREIAEQIYRERYWDAMDLESVTNINPEIAIEMMECGVNMGCSIAISFLQKSLNALNRGKGRNLATDGVIGKNTLKVLRGLPDKDFSTVVKMQNALQGSRYITLAQRNKSLKKFVRGWFKRVLIN